MNEGAIATKVEISDFNAAIAANNDRFFEEVYPLYPRIDAFVPAAADVVLDPFTGRHVLAEITVSMDETIELTANACFRALNQQQGSR